ncbi:glycosyltransferase family 4 protein [Gracilibacillus dipsosauri]|uniref:glycosyltransferase family 4 protein n=1 Tax=Gracilibacillus dipsosauri TaxID=178340 RepID=UPI002409D9A4
MKILVVCQYYYPEPFRISDICESLVRKGHDVTILTGLPNYPEGKVLAEYRRGNKRNEILNGVKILRCFEIGRGDNKVRLFLNYFSFTVSASLKVLFLKEKYDVVFVNQLSPITMGIPAILYKKIHKKKVFLYCLDLWPASLTAGGIRENAFVYKVFLKLSRWIYNSVDSIAVTSSMFRDYFNKTIGIKGKEIQHMPQYAENLFTKLVNEKLDDKYNFVFAGNIGDMQSVETIVKAAFELRSRTDIIFHIVGDGSKLEKCKELSKEYKLNNIIFYGRKPLNEMPQFYGIADAMLLTLKDNKEISSTLPGKVQSYMAARKPIIAAINGEAKRVIREADCGFCCDAEDYKGLARLIIKFIKSVKKDRMAQNSYDYYVKNYSKEKFIEMLENTLINLEATNV